MLPTTPCNCLNYCRLSATRFRVACVRPLLFCSDPMLSSFAYPAPLRFSHHCYPRSAPTLRERAPGSEEIRPDPSPFAYSAPQLSAACFREVDGSGRRRVAADIKGNGYRGARGKGCSGRTAGVCLSAGRSVAPRELAGRTPFPARDRRSPPWSRHSSSAASLPPPGQKREM